MQLFDWRYTFKNVHHPPSIEFFHQIKNASEPTVQKARIEYNGRKNDIVNLRLKGLREDLFRVDSDREYTEINLGELNKEVDVSKLNVTFENGGLEALRYRFSD